MTTKPSALSERISEMTQISNIGVRIEGGIGDVILANRFVAAICEQYGDKVTAYVDSEGNPLQEKVLRTYWPRFYKEIITIPSKRRKPFMIKSEFGVEESIGAWENILPEFHDRFSTHEKFYDLHIDALRWMYYDFDWRRYFSFFPRPEVTTPRPNEANYIVFHPLREKLDNRCLSLPWIEAFLKNLKCRRVVLSIEEHRKLLAPICERTSAEFVCKDFEHAVREIEHCSCFVGIDSGLKYFAYSYNRPSLNLMPFCQLFQPAPHLKIRWHIFSESSIHLDTPPEHVARMVENIMKHPAGYLFPTTSDLPRAIVERHYTPC